MFCAWQHYIYNFWHSFHARALPLRCCSHTFSCQRAWCLNQQALFHNIEIHLLQNKTKIACNSLDNIYVFFTINWFRCRSVETFAGKTAAKTVDLLHSPPRSWVGPWPWCCSCQIQQAWMGCPLRCRQWCCRRVRTVEWQQRVTYVKLFVYSDGMWFITLYVRSVHNRCKWCVCINAETARLSCICTELSAILR